MRIGHDGLLLVVGLVVLPHITRSPVMPFEFEFTEKCKQKTLIKCEI